MLTRWLMRRAECRAAASSCTRGFLFMELQDLINSKKYYGKNGLNLNQVFAPINFCFHGFARNNQSLLIVRPISYHEIQPLTISRV